MHRFAAQSIAPLQFMATVVNLQPKTFCALLSHSAQTTPARGILFAMRRLPCQWTALSFLDANRNLPAGPSGPVGLAVAS